MIIALVFDEFNRSGITDIAKYAELTRCLTQPLFAIDSECSVCEP